MARDCRPREVLVVGTGVAGTRAAETLREEGYDGALTMVGAERHAPYQRPPLLKSCSPARSTGRADKASFPPEPPE